MWSWEEDDIICQWQGQPWGNCNIALVISTPGPGQVRDGEGPSGGSRVQASCVQLECPEQAESADTRASLQTWHCAQPSHVLAPRYSQHTLARVKSRVYPFLGVNYKLARGSFSRRGRVTFSVTFIVWPWGSIGSLHSDKWHDLGDLNIVIMTLSLTIVILFSTVYLGHLLDPDTER